MCAGPPIITFISNHTISLEGNKVNLICNATNDPDAVHALQVNWYKGGKRIKSNGTQILFYYKTDIDATNTSNIHSVILFDSVSHTDHGEYTCRAYNHPQSYSELKTNLTVECEELLCYLIV